MPGFRIPSLQNTRKMNLARPGVISLIALAAVLAAYAIKILPVSRTLFVRVLRTAHGSEILDLHAAFYGVGGVAAFLLLMMLLRSLDFVMRRFSKPVPFNSRPGRTLDEFTAEAASMQIGSRTAYECYTLLQACYPKQMSIRLRDDLRRDLGMNDESICEAFAAIATRLTHSEGQGVAATGINTVLDLAASLERLPLSERHRSGIRGRATDMLTETGLLDDASIEAHGAEGVLNGLHRRSSDYAGPRRRLTDKRAEVKYTGPFRRKSDGASLTKDTEWCDAGQQTPDARGRVATSPPGPSHSSKSTVPQPGFGAKVYLSPHK